MLARGSQGTEDKEETECLITGQASAAEGRARAKRKVIDTVEDAPETFSQNSEEMASPINPVREKMTTV